MRNLDENTITAATIARHEDCGNPRTKVLMTKLIESLHEFAREVELTEEELESGIAFLTAVGKKCSDTRQEFILLSDTLGLSTLVCAQNNRKPKECTESTVFGPFHLENSPSLPMGADISKDTSGEPCFVSGVVRNPNGEPIEGAMIEVWQADGAGFYDVQYSDYHEHRLRATFRAGADGAYRFRTVVPASYPIETDGPVGTLLSMLGRHPWRPAHLHYRIAVPGYQTLVTHIFRDGDPYLDSDAVFGVRSTLVGEWIRHTDTRAPGGEPMKGPFYTLNYDFVLSPEQSKTGVPAEADNGEYEKV
jgi:hydroxyquinol 1,2-dioxygenase